MAQVAMGILLGQRSVLSLSQQLFRPTKAVTSILLVPEFKQVTRATSQQASGTSVGCGTERQVTLF